MARVRVEQFKVQDRWMFKGYLTPVTDELEAVVTINAKGIIQVRLLFPPRYLLRLHFRIRDGVTRGSP
jgi:hypothetical protein